MNNGQIVSQAKQKINKAFVNKTSAPNTGQKIYWDDEVKGFGLRVTSGGSRAYVVQSRIYGRTVRRTIGEHGVYTPEQAKLEAKKLLLKMHDGIDPKLAASDQKTRNLTLGYIFDAYKKSKNLREKTISLYDGIMQRCLPDWQNKPIVSISRDMVEKRLQKLANKNSSRGPGRAQAGQCYRLLRSIVRFTQENYEIRGKPILDVDPTRNLSKDREWTRNIRRQGIIQKHKLKNWFQAVMSLDNTTVRDYLLFTLLTGLRRNESMMLEWTEVDLDGKCLKISAGRTKNHKEHSLPLSDYLYELLKTREDNNNDNSPYVFPSPVNSATYLKEPKRLLNKVREKTGIQFMLHDLRRTFITIADYLRLSQYTLKKLLNHSTAADVTGGYIIAEMERLRQPMQEITDHILEEAGIKRTN